MHMRFLWPQRAKRFVGRNRVIKEGCASAYIYYICVYALFSLYILFFYPVLFSLTLARFSLSVYILFRSAYITYYNTICVWANENLVQRVEQLLTWVNAPARRTMQHCFQVRLVPRRGLSPLSAYAPAGTRPSGKYTTIGQCS